MPRLIEWDTLEFRLSGERIAAIVGELIERKKLPVPSLFLEFKEGELFVEGTFKKGFSIPFQGTIRSIRPDRAWLHIKLDEVSAFGLPVPAFLQKFIEGQVRDGSVKYEDATKELAIDIGRNIPGFIDVAIDTVRLVRGGVAITLGPGGADIPPPPPREAKA